MKKLAFVVLLIILLVAWIFLKQSQIAPVHSKSMTITSPAFATNGEIPQLFGCSGKGVNPPLMFSGLPRDTKSLVLIVDDPDAPLRTFTHWIVYNIDPKISGIEENSLPSGAKQGPNSAGHENYTPPCPPTGTHHYHFKLYALDAVVSFEAMQGHIIDQAELVGLYQR